MCTSNRDDRKLENTVKKSRFKHLGELHKEWTEAGVSASSILPGLRRKITGLLLSGTKSSFQIKVNFAFHLEIKLWRKTGIQNPCLLEVQCEVSTVSDDLGCHDVCWCWSIVFYQVESQCSRLPGDFRALYARGLHGSQNSYPNPKRPIKMLLGTDPDPYFIWKWDPNSYRPEKCLKCTTQTRRGPDHYSKVGPEPGWEDTDPTAPKKKFGLKC